MHQIRPPVDSSQWTSSAVEVQLDDFWMPAGQRILGLVPPKDLSTKVLKVDQQPYCLSSLY